MAVMRVHKNANYTIMSNYHFKEKNMSLKAKGLLSLMLSLPDDWDYSINGLATLSKDGKDSVISGLKELEQFGYLKRTRITNELGHFKGYDYDIYEMPQNFEPYSENPHTDCPTMENPLQLNTNKINDLTTNNDKKDKRQTPHFFTLELIKNNYISDLDLYIDKYNDFFVYMLDNYEFEIVRSCLWYFIKQSKSRDINNRLAYCRTAIEDGAKRLSRQFNEMPQSYNWLVN